MRKNYWIVVGLALTMALTPACAPGEDQGHTATVVEVVNEVDAHARPKDDWGPAEVDMVIYSGGRVRTGAASSAQVALLEGIVRLASQSVFTVKGSTTRQGTLETTLFLEEGRLWAHLTTAQEHEFTVETGNAVAAVRDSHFSVEVTAGSTFVSVAAGRVELTAQGQSVVVAAGQQTTAEPGQPPSPPEPMSDEEWEQWAAEAEEVHIEALDRALPTVTPVPPTPTATPQATATPVPPAATSTPTPTRAPTATVTPTPTAVPGPPTIISIDFPSEVAAGGDAVGGTVRFQDPDGDVNWVAFDVVSATEFTPFAFNPAEHLDEGQTRDGTFGFHMWCSTVQNVTLRVTLFDAAGNSSAPVNFSFSCR